MTRAAWALRGLAAICQDRATWELATTHFLQSLEAAGDAVDPAVTVFSLVGLAGSLARLPQCSNAPLLAALIGAADAALDASGIDVPPVERPDCDRNVANVCDRLSETSWFVALARGRAMALNDAIFEARWLATVTLRRCGGAARPRRLCYTGG